jgi:hypothetical protein
VAALGPPGLAIDDAERDDAEAWPRSERCAEPVGSSSVGQPAVVVEKYDDVTGRGLETGIAAGRHASVLVQRDKVNPGERGADRSTVGDEYDLNSGAMLRLDAGHRTRDLVGPVALGEDDAREREDSLRLRPEICTGVCGLLSARQLSLRDSRMLAR